MAEPSPLNGSEFVDWVIENRQPCQFFIDRLGLPQSERQRSQLGYPAFKDDDTKSCANLYKAKLASTKRLLENFSSRALLREAAVYDQSTLLEQFAEPLLVKFGPTIWGDCEPSMTRVGLPEYPKQLVFNDNDDRVVIKVLLLAWIVERAIRQFPKSSPSKPSGHPSARPKARIPRTGDSYTKHQYAKHRGQSTLHGPRYRRPVIEDDSDCDLSPGVITETDNSRSGDSLVGDGRPPRVPVARMISAATDDPATSHRSESSGLAQGTQNSVEAIFPVGEREVRGTKRADDSMNSSSINSEKRQKRDHAVYRSVNIELSHAGSYPSPPLTYLERGQSGRTTNSPDDAQQNSSSGQGNKIIHVSSSSNRNVGILSQPPSLPVSRHVPAMTGIDSVQGGFEGPQDKEEVISKSKGAHRRKSLIVKMKIRSKEQELNEGDRRVTPKDPIHGDAPEEASAKSVAPDLNPDQTSFSHFPQEMGETGPDNLVPRAAPSRSESSAVSEQVDIQRWRLASNLIDILSSDLFDHAVAETLQLTVQLTQSLLVSDRSRLQTTCGASFERHLAATETWLRCIQAALKYNELAGFEADRAKRKEKLQALESSSDRRAAQKCALDFLISMRTLQQGNEPGALDLSSRLAYMLNSMADWTSAFDGNEADIAVRLEKLNESLLSWIK